MRALPGAARADSSATARSRTFVNVYVEGEDVRTLDGLDTPVARRPDGHPAAGHGRRLLAPLPPAPFSSSSATPRSSSCPHLSPPGVTIYAKLEGQNPTGSIEGSRRARDDRGGGGGGELEPGRELLEPTSRQHRASRSRSSRSSRAIRSRASCPRTRPRSGGSCCGSTARRSSSRPAREGSNGAVRLALELAGREPRYFMPFQYANEANPRAHYEGTGAEIVAALDRGRRPRRGPRHRRHAHGRGRARCGRASPTSSSRPPSRCRAIRSWACARSTTATCRRSSTSRRSTASSSSRTTTPVDGLRALLDKEGIFAGVSSGAVVHVARRLAGELEEGSVVVCILPDGGWKYLSAGFWHGDEIEEDKLWW